MKIAVVGRFYEEGFATFVAQALADMKHEPVRFDPAAPLVPFGSRAAFYINRLLSKGHETVMAAARTLGLSADGRALVRAVEAAGGVDLIIACHDFLTPADAQQVKQAARAPLALWYPDPIWSFQRHMFLNAPYDFLFFKDPYLVDILRRKIGANAFYLPECFSPRSLCSEDAPEAQYQADICTAGNLYAYRVALFRHLEGRDVKIWGLPAPLWMDTRGIEPMIQNRFVAHSEKAKAFRSAKIVLNNLNPAEIWGTNVRTFEICGAGAFQLVDWRPGLPQLFEPGKELVAFDGLEDMKAKIDHYLGAPQERDAIAAAGQARALREHTYEHRLRLLLDTVAGARAGFDMPRAGGGPAW
ncbi:CgeB family protein [Ramlibacter sp. PS4R-6]|uniref:CgeB family protein n=1 Tax=Ramlibacter sp. PS4R-6 TaxID=3133438 RepID=UPI0030B79AE3